MAFREFVLALFGAAVLFMTSSESFARAPEEAQKSPPTERAPMSLLADRELLHQAMTEAGISKDRARPGPALWARDAGLALRRWMVSWMDRVAPRLDRQLMPFVEIVLTILLAFSGAILLIVLMRWVWDRATHRSSPATHVAVLPSIPSSERTLPDWESELERRLRSGDVAASIEALWWWLATALVGTRVEPAWTSRELVVWADRPDLLTDVRRLDHMMYGAVSPEAGDVRRLWQDLRKAME